MKKKDFVKMLAERMEVSQKGADVALSSVFDCIKDVMVSGDDLNVPGFGKFKTTIRAARTCRNPQTGDPIEVPEKRVLKFKASSAIKNIIS